MFLRDPKALLLALFTGALLVGCGGDGSGTDGSGTGADTLDTVAHGGKASLVKVGGKLFNVPSPVETALLIKKSGMAYQKDRTLAMDAGDKLSGKMERGLALGAYGADMAYVTIHRDGARALSTLQAIEKLGTALEMSNAFDRALIDRYRSNLNNEDSLLQMSGDAFRAADQYLKGNDRNDLSAVILAGGWIESMHLILAETTLNDQLATRVGEQKRTITDLIGLLTESDKEGQCAALVEKLKAVQAVLSTVSTMYQFAEPITDAAARTTTITSKSSVAISADQIKAMRDRIAELRASFTA